MAAFSPSSSVRARSNSLIRTLQERTESTKTVGKQEDGHIVVTANTAADVLTLLSLRAFDVMLTDVIMPGNMDGIELAKRAQGLYPAMEILLMSGFSRETAASRGDLPWPLLVKPFLRTDFLKVLHAKSVDLNSSRPDQPETHGV